MIDELNSKYAEFKEVLDVLPVNTKYNRKRKMDYILEEEKKDNDRFAIVKNEIESRLKSLYNLKINDKIAKLNEELEKCNIVNEWNDYNTAYEKMHLDYYLYQLHRYYKEDLESVNVCIKMIVESFNKVNIILTKDDFDFSSNAALYMDKLLNNASNDELNKCFEEIYWKDSDIIKIIEVNFKSIYLRNEKKINKYYAERHKEFLEKHHDDEIYLMRVKLSDNIKYLKGIDPYLNLDKFINKEYNTKDFTEAEIIKKRDVYFEENSYSFEGLKKLYKSLTEYDMLLTYNYLLVDMRARLEKKNEFKGIVDKSLKEISKDEAKLKKLIASHDKKPLFGLKKKNDEQWLFEYKNTLSSIQEKYTKLDEDRFNELIFNKLSKDSFVYDILRFIASHYLYFVKRTKELDDSLTIDLINDRYEKLRDEIYNNDDYMLITNLALLDERQIKEIIIDKYNLQNIKISVDYLDKDNIQNTINNIELLINYEYFVESGLNIDDIDLYLEYSKYKNE